MNDDVKECIDTGLQVQLRNLLLKQLAQCITKNDRAGRKHQFNVLVMDAYSARILSACCRMQDLFRIGIQVLHNLSLAREPVPGNGIYLIRPDKNSIQSIVNDFANSHKPQYLSAHVIAVNHITDSLMERIAQAPGLRARLQSLIEIHCDWLVVDERTVSLDVMSSSPEDVNSLLGRLYKPRARQQPQFNPLMENLAHRFASFIALRPSSKITLRFPVDSPIAQSLAMMIEARLQQTHAVQPTAVSAAADVRVLVLDRSIDVLAPLVRDFRYGSLVHDLLHVDGERVKLSKKSNSRAAAADDDDQCAFLSRSHSSWLQWRHQHVAVVMQQLHAQCKELRQHNAAAALHNGLVDGSDVRHLSAAIRDMGAYQDQSKQLSEHMSMLEAMGDMTLLMYVGHLEQDLATLVSGMDPGHRALESGQLRRLLSQLCLDARIKPLDKLRLLMIASCTARASMKDSDTAEWLRAADVPLALRPCLSCLQLIDPLNRSNEMARKRLPEFVARTKRDARPGALELQRYEPALGRLLASFVQDALTPDLYPCVVVAEPVGPVASDPTPPAVAAAEQRRISQASRPNRWRRRSKHSKRPSQSDDGAVASSRDRVDRTLYVVLMIGDTGLNEAALIHDVALHHHADLQLATTSIVSPATYVTRLAAMLQS